MTEHPRKLGFSVVFVLLTFKYFKYTVFSDKCENNTYHLKYGQIIF